MRKLARAARHSLILTASLLGGCFLYDDSTQVSDQLSSEFAVAMRWATLNETGSVDTLPPATVGTSYSVRFDLDNVNSAPPNCDLGVSDQSIVAAVPGMTNSISTGQAVTLEGLPTQPGTYQVSVKLVFDPQPSAVLGLQCVQSGGSTRVFQLTVNVAPELAISTSSLPSGDVGLPYSTALAAVGGTAPLIWSLASASEPVPAGLALSTAGVLAGTPTAAGTFAITLELQDALGAVVTRELTLTIDAPVGSVFAISPATLPSGVVGELYSSPLSTTGGTPSASWTIQSGALPAGLQLDLTTGEIAGAPTLAGAYSFTVSVFDQSAPAQQATRTLSMTVVNPLPVAQTLAPASVLAGSGSFDIDVGGTGFMNGAVVLWNGSDLATVFNSATQLRATVSASDVATAGTASVTVRNPAPGGGSSNVLAFQIEHPVPTLSVLMPDNANAGTPSFVMTALGTDFAPNSVVRWSGSDRLTAFVSATEVVAQISAADIQSAGTAAVTVFTPTPGGGSSSPLTFTINPAVPPTPGNNAGVTERVSVSSTGVVANASSGVTSGGETLDLSEDGDVVAFQSDATNLDLTHGGVFVRRVSTGSTRQVSRGLGGAAPNALTGEGVAISGNGDWVAFVSRANNLVEGDTSDTQGGEIFVANSCVPVASGPVLCPTPEIGSVMAGGAQPPSGASTSPDLSFNGNRLVFASSSDLLTGFGSFGTQIWLRDRQADTTELISVDAAGNPGTGFSSRPRISRSGRFVVFVSESSNLVAGDTNGRSDVFMRDTCLGAPGPCTPSTTRVSVDSNGAQQLGGGLNRPADISDDGRYVAFDSDATNLVPGSSAFVDVYLRDRFLGTTVAICGAMALCTNPSMSGDGRLVSFEQDSQIWVRDTCIGAAGGCTPNAFVVSRVIGGADANGSGATFARIAGDGFTIVFTSRATNLVTGANGFNHVYRARNAGP